MVTTATAAWFWLTPFAKRLSLSTETRLLISKHTILKGGRFPEDFPVSFLCLHFLRVYINNYIHICGEPSKTAVYIWNWFQGAERILQKRTNVIYYEGEPLHIFLMWIFYQCFIVIRVFMSFLNKNSKCCCSYVPVALVVQSAEKHGAWCKDACVTLPKILNMIT